MEIKYHKYALRTDIIKYGAVITALFTIGLGLILSFAGNYPTIITLAFLSFTLGLSHAFDVDHIAAIDNITRKMMNEGKNTHGVGFSFSFGHSIVVFLMTMFTVGLVDLTKQSQGSITEFGHVFGTLIAGITLLLLAAINVYLLWSLIKSNPDKPADKTNWVFKLLNKFLSLINHNWQVMIVGFLFGIGFDTATQIAVMTTSVVAATKGVPFIIVLGFPLLFTAGMCLMDTLDGIFMTSAYGWFLSSPSRKIKYNIIITGISAAAAILIGSIDVLQSLASNFNWNNQWIVAITHLDFHTLGVTLLLIFIIAWGIAGLTWKYHQKSKN